MNTDPSQHVLMLGTFGFQPKATMRARALGIARALRSRGWSATVGTTPWDFPPDAGRCWTEDGVRLRNTRSTRPLLWPLAVGEMVAWARADRAAILHVFKPKGFGDLAGRRLRRAVPVVVDMDDWEGNGGWNDMGLYGPLQRRLFDWQERSWPRQAAALTVASRELERRAIDLGASPTAVHYVPNGLSQRRFAQLTPDPAAAAAFRAACLGEGAPNVLLYTRFVEFDPALPARLIAAIRRQHPDARLVVAGSSATSAPEQALFDEARRLGVEPAIVALGWTDPAELPAIAGVCDVAVHPFDDTRLNRAKSSVKLLELMATGIPVVTTSVGENTAFIVSGQSGLLVPPSDEAALVAAALSVLGDSQLAWRLGQAARERIGSDFVWDHLVGRALDAYRHALERFR